MCTSYESKDVAGAAFPRESGRTDLVHGAHFMLSKIEMNVVVFGRFTFLLFIHISRGDLGSIDSEAFDFSQLEEYINDDNENNIYFHDALVTSSDLKLSEEKSPPFGRQQGLTSLARQPTGFRFRATFSPPNEDPKLKCPPPRAAPPPPAVRDVPARPRGPEAPPPLPALRPAPAEAACRRRVHIIIHIAHITTPPRESRALHPLSVHARVDFSVHVGSDTDPHLRAQQPTTAADHIRALAPLRRKRKLPESPKIPRNGNGVQVKVEPSIQSPDPTTTVLPSSDEDYNFELSAAEANALFVDSSFQCIRFQPFQPNTWIQLLDKDIKEIASPNFRVDADKGFNYSNADESFVCQKKNHFQVTVHVQPVADAHYARTPRAPGP
ncbi:myelin regulatory factor [Caerostris extrusa]|uniref:Myelin regulatory factor n=1 Tax=Caerostris extrusa TaxID=172846 RepID=A0AAV4QVH4_CAEEX|nr:myelin regulatory factor [Caerostris extrusa]